MTPTCEVGSSKLWLGQPLVVSVPSGAESSLANIGTNSVRRPTPLEVKLPPGVAAYETLDLSPGTYELRVEKSGKKAVLPEFLWILTREDYRETALAEAAEQFGFEPVVSNAGELMGLLNGDIAAIWPGVENPFAVSWSKDDSAVLYSPLQWSVDSMLRSLKYIQAFQVVALTGFISIAGHRLEISLDAKFQYTIPPAISSTFHDRECCDLYLMNANDDLGDFEVDIDVAKNRAHIAVRQAVPELQYA